MVAGVHDELKMSGTGVLLWALMCAAPVVWCRTLPEVAPATAGMDAATLAGIAPLVEEGIHRGDYPGAAVLIGRRNQIVYQQAFGQRAVKPKPAPMTRDTIFDLASLTKVVATAPAIMQLVESGRLSLEDKISKWVPACDRADKRAITLRQLLAHDSGLRPGFEEPTLKQIHGYEDGVRLACEQKTFGPPGKQFRYSDLNYILLGEVVRIVSGQPLDVYAQQALFQPLDMTDTSFRPAAALQDRIAATDVMTGQVEDGAAWRMGGVAGHAGIYSTTDDLALYCAMLLAEGVDDRGVRVLSPLAVERMTTTATDHTNGLRGLGFDIDTAYSGPRGDLFPYGSYGHTGYSGTSIWLDPHSGVFVIILTNRLHPDGHGDVRELRMRVATVAAAAIRDVGGAAEQTETAMPVKAGIDVLRERAFEPLRGKRVGLLTQRAEVAGDGRTTIAVLHSAPEVKLVALFSPEHGLDADANDIVASNTDAETGLPVYSLYGADRKPTAGMLRGIDAVIIDLQDVGAQIYTYMTTMAYMLEAAAAQHIPVFVLDRPNPINGADIEGPRPDADQPAFTHYFPLTLRHGMTMGELAALFNAEKKIGADLTVIPMQDWRRTDWFDETGLSWRNPSPNLHSLTQALLYAGIGAIEDTAVSVGRGTDAPFEQIGAPWVDGARLAQALNTQALPGVRFYPVQFTPAAAPYAGQICHGVHLLVTDRNRFRPVRTALEIAVALHHLSGAGYHLPQQPSLLGTRHILEQVLAGDSAARIAAGWEADEQAWQQLRQKYLLYP
jgi:uncharacterized protein YbbC (DUF1343 family)